jgi:hypothetical protein
MQTITIPSTLSNGRLSLTKPEEIKRLVELGKSRGLIKGADDKATINKNGINLAQLANVWMQKVDVTPEMAAYWLRNNFRNRPISDDVVTAYARDMLAGQWVFTHQGIAFNDQDQLIDGQHRLKAIIKANITVPMMVTFGLPSKIDGKEMTTMDCVDRGRTRSVADQLKIQHGISNASIIAAVCGSIANLCFGERTRRLSVGHTLIIYKEFSHAIDWVISHRSKHKGLKAAGVLAGFAFAMASEGRFWEGKMTACKMFESVMTGLHLKDGTAMALLHKFLTSEESALFTPSLNRGLAELVLHAIYLDLQGALVEKLDPPEDGQEYPGVIHFRELQKGPAEKIAALFALPKPEQKPTLAPPKAPERPSLDKILTAVESHLKISRAIIIGRGQGDDITMARSMVVNLGLSFGHTFESIGVILKRTETGTIQKLHIPKQYWGTKQTKTFESLKAQLTK